MLIDYNCESLFIQMIQKEPIIKSASIHQIIHKELPMEKLFYRLVLHNLRGYQTAQRVGISKEGLKLQSLHYF